MCLAGFYSLWRNEYANQGPASCADDGGNDELVFGIWPDGNVAGGAGTVRFGKPGAAGAGAVSAAVGRIAGNSGAASRGGGGRTRIGAAWVRGWAEPVGAGQAGGGGRLPASRRPRRGGLS